MVNADILKLVDESLEQIANPRTREILACRFGLRDGRRKTLEAIGRDHRVTRERVRQIEEAGMAAIKQSTIIDKLHSVFEIFDKCLSEHGALRKEDALYDDLICFCFPAKVTEWRRGDEAGLNRCRSVFYFFLTLGDNFERMPETDHFYAFWTNDCDAVKMARQTVDSLIKHFSVGKKVLSREELFGAVQNFSPGLSDKAIYSYLDASKRVEKNYLGHFGLSHWPEINPRGVRDKAHIILKNHGQPMHFSEVTEAINRNLASGRQAYVQTVHNELIKDGRFVLVGRGLYALADWGYEPGTVTEIIQSLLAREGALTREEIIKRVLEKRRVKENTVLINLQNRRLFERDSEGRYAVRK